MRLIEKGLIVGDPPTKSY